VQLGDPLFIPENFESAEDRATVVDRGINLLTMYAERAAIWVWDECIHVAAQVTASDAASGGGAGGGLTDAELRASPVEVELVAPLPLMVEGALPGGAIAVEGNVTVVDGVIAINEPEIVSSDATDSANPNASLYWGFTLRNSHVTDAAVITIHDGDANNDPLLDTVSLAAGESARELYPHPLPVTSGEMFIDITGGTVTGRIRTSA
jgi:hypothetical protein